MKNPNSFAVSATTVTLLLLISACTESATDMAPGKYERTMKTTDEYGTTTKQERSTEVYEDEYGNKKAVIESETTTDPKGLFNKRTSKSKQVIEEERY